MNTGKTSVIVEEGPAGEDESRKLAAACDVIVTDRPDHLSLGGADEAMIVVAITPFGLTGPVRGLPRPPPHAVPRRRRGAPAAERRGVAPASPTARRSRSEARRATYDAGLNAAVAVLAASSGAPHGSGPAHRRLGPGVARSR